MLSKNVQQGTRVVGIPDPGYRHYMNDTFMHLGPYFATTDHEGVVLTVDALVPCKYTTNGIAVKFVELPEGLFPLDCYRALELPGWLTGLLVGVRQPEFA